MAPWSHTATRLPAMLDWSGCPQRGWRGRAGGGGDDCYWIWNVDHLEWASYSGQERIDSLIWKIKKKVLIMISNVTGWNVVLLRGSHPVHVLFDVFIYSTIKITNSQKHILKYFLPVYLQSDSSLIAITPLNEEPLLFIMHQTKLN